jgi:clan AA aspartic protease
MGLVYTSITLKNSRLPELRPMEANALVDTGALHLCIPEHVAIQLRLDRLYEREVTSADTADGSKRLCPYVGPLEVHFGDRACFTGALVLGDEVLLGAVPMEDMDLVISPAVRTVTVNPASPNIPSSTVKLVAWAMFNETAEHVTKDDIEERESLLVSFAGRP